MFSLFRSNHLFCRFILCLTLITLFIPANAAPQTNINHLELPLMTFNDSLKLIELVEEDSGSLQYFDQEELASIFAFFASQGLPEDDLDASIELSRDIEELFSLQDDPLFWDPEEQINPEQFQWADTLSTYGYEAVSCGWLKKKWKKTKHAAKKTKKFVKKHKKAIIIGAAVVVVGTVVIAAVASTGGGAAAAAAAAGGTSEGGAAAGAAAAGGAAIASKSKEKKSAPVKQLTPPSALPKDIAKEVMGMKQPLHNTPSKGAPFIQETRAAAVHKADQLIHQITQNHSSLQREIAIQSAGQFKDQMLSPKLPNFTPGTYQISSQHSLKTGQPQQALTQLNTAIQCNPQNKGAYLDRAMLHHHMGEPAKAASDLNQLEDYDPIAIRDQIMEKSELYATLGMASGAANVAKNTTQAILHPIDSLQKGKEFVVNFAETAKDVVQNPKEMAHKLSNACKEWAQEISDLPLEEGSYQLGQLAGETATNAALISKGTKLATTTLTKKAPTLITTEETIKKVSSTPKKLPTGTPKIAAKTKATAKPQPPREKIARHSKSDARHAGQVRNYENRSIKEIQKSIASFDKQIAIHSDKITNPQKYIPNWESLDVRQRKALVMQKWPSDIQRLKEQKNAMKQLLNTKVK